MYFPIVGPNQEKKSKSWKTKFCKNARKGFKNLNIVLRNGLRKLCLPQFSWRTPSETSQMLDRPPTIPPILHLSKNGKHSLINCNWLYYSYNRLYFSNFCDFSKSEVSRVWLGVFHASEMFRRVFSMKIEEDTISGNPSSCIIDEFWSILSAPCIFWLWVQIKRKNQNLQKRSFASMLEKDSKISKMY